MKIKNQKDFYCGLLFIVSGLGFSIVSSTYKMGTANRMGPGYFPFWLGILLTILGALVSVGSLSPKTEQNRIARWDFKSIFWVLGSVIIFGLVLNWLGLVLSLILLVFVSSKASHEFEWLGTGFNSIVMVAISMTLFVYGLNLQVKIWPAFMGG